MLHSECVAWTLLMLFGCYHIQNNKNTELCLGNVIAFWLIICVYYVWAMLLLGFINSGQCFMTYYLCLLCLGNVIAF